VGCLITFACVYWQGEFRGRERIYTPEWVLKLKRMVARHYNQEHRFVCLTNTVVDCETIPLIYNLPGWWSKMELFSGALTGRVVYFDLDLVLLNSITPIADYQSGFVICGAFGQPNKEHGTVHAYNSSVMSFDADKAERFWFEFDAESMTDFRGDQDFIAHVDGGLDTFPRDWVRKLRDGEPKEGTKVVLCMPDKNKVAAKKHKWIADAWG
jgi:hypothetical protein